MKNFVLLALCAALILPLSVSKASALNAPERLVYEVSWTGVKAATTVHEVAVKGNEFHFVSTTRSAPWVNTFFSVNDRAESVLTRGLGDRFGTPKYYWQQNNQGSHHALREARFDPLKLRVEGRDLLKKTAKTEAISARTYDSLSGIYFVRSLDLVPGKSVYLDIYDCKRSWNTEVKVLRREEIVTPVGRFKTLVVKPLLKADGETPKSTDLTIWLSDDSLRIPVMMTTKAKVGKITAMLVGGSYWPQS
jgi:hypothetical protein